MSTRNWIYSSNYYFNILYALFVISCRYCSQCYSVSVVYISMACRICHTSFAVIWTSVIFSFQVRHKLGSCCFVIFLSVACYSCPGLHRLWTCKRKFFRPSCLVWLLPLITSFLCYQRLCSHTVKQPKCWHFCWHCVWAWFLPITKPVIKIQKITENRNFQCSSAFKSGGRYKARTCGRMPLRVRRPRLIRAAMPHSDGSQVRVYSISHKKKTCNS